MNVARQASKHERPLANEGYGGTGRLVEVDSGAQLVVGRDSCMGHVADELRLPSAVRAESMGEMERNSLDHQRRPCDSPSP
jgi:hypothetical protein